MFYSPFLYPLLCLLFPGAHLCQNQYSLALGNAFSSHIGLFLVAPFFYWPFVQHLLDFQRKVTTTVPVVGCRSVWWHFGWIQLLLTLFFLLSFFISACDFFLLKALLRNFCLCFVKCHPKYIFKGTSIFS